MSTSYAVALYRLFCLAVVLAGWSSMHEAGLALTVAAAGALLLNPSRFLRAATPAEWRRLDTATSDVLVSDASEYDVGYAYFRAGRFQDAVTLLQRVVARDELDADAQYYLGTSLVELKRDAAAVAALERAVSARPLHAEAHERLGLALLRLGHVPAACAALREALRLRPQLAAARRGLTGLDDMVGSRRLRQGHPAARRRSAPDSHFGPRAA